MHITLARDEQTLHHTHTPVGLGFGVGGKTYDMQSG